MTDRAPGPAPGGVGQLGYVVEDLERSAMEFTARLGVGPWFVSGPFVAGEGRYRGQPVEVAMSLAVTFAGDMMIELIQQHDDAPSAYRDMRRARSYGFHHWGIFTERYDADVDGYRRDGREPVFSGRTPRGVRFAYFDMGGELPGMVELIESSEGPRAIYRSFADAARDWDGADPFRRL